MLKTFSKIQRPYVEFDPTNVDHRQHYKKFLQTNTWSHCPCQWFIDDYSVDVVHFINNKIVEYYISTDSALVTKQITAKVATPKRKQK